MSWILRLAGLLALAATIGPSILYFADSMELATVQRWMLLATLAWFVVQGLAVYRKRESG